MKVVRQGEAQPSAADTFTGNVELTRVLPDHQDGGMALSIVHFEDGARTHWHAHPGEQILYILDGEGRAGTAAGETVVHPGDVVYTARGERHWHGATPGASMTHISVTTVGSPTWFEAPDEAGDDDH